MVSLGIPTEAPVHTLVFTAAYTQKTDFAVVKKKVGFLSRK